MKYLTALLLIISYPAQSQTGILPYTNNIVVYTNVIETQAHKKDVLVSVKMKLNNQANVINATVSQLENKMKDYIVQEDSTMLISNVSFLTNQLLNTALWQAQLTVDVKDGRYKYELTNITCANSTFFGKGSMKVEDIDIPKQKKMIALLNKEIETFITGVAAPVANSDW